MTGQDPAFAPKGEKVVARHGPDAPDVSVIIPSFNRERLLGEAVASVIAQGGRHRVEVVIVDDGSSDGSVDAAMAAVGPATGALVLRQPNAGPSAARNAGIRHARGRFLSFLDSDDRLVAGKIDRQIELLARDPSAGLCVGRWGWYDARFERLIAAFGPHRADTWPILPGFLRNEHFPVATGLFRREVVLAAKPWPETMRNWEDHTWMIGMGLQGVRSIHLPSEVLQVREHTEARLSGTSRERACEVNAAFARVLLAFDWPDDPALRDALAERLLVLAQAVYCGGRAEEGQRIFDRAEDVAGTFAARQTIRGLWIAMRAAPGTPGAELAQRTTERLIGLRTRARWHLPSAAWRPWIPETQPAR